MTRTLAAVSLRDLTDADRGRIEAISRSVGIFRDDEIRIALEVFDASRLPSQTDYQTLGADLDGSLVGWACWGPTPCTVGTWDLYWIAVDPAVQGEGVGSRLLDEVERRLAGSARMLMAETSGRRDYAATRTFYLARQFQRTAVVPEYYAAGDDQVIFTKMLPGSPRPA